MGETKTTIEPWTPRALAASEPDLTLKIGGVGGSETGEQPKIFLCHSAILASQSGFVDNLLLSSKKDQTTTTATEVSFPDISPRSWDKMMYSLGPNKVLDIKDLLEILPFFEKYQFHQGVDLCDRVFSKRIIDYPGDDAATMAVMSIEMNLPLTKPLAFQYASNLFQNAHSLDNELFASLIQAVQHDQNVMDSLFSCLGQKNLSAEERKELIQQPDFPRKYKVAVGQIWEIEERIKLIGVSNVIIHHSSSSTASSRADGKYTSSLTVSGRGVLRCSYNLQL